MRTDESNKLLNPEAIKRISRLDMRAKHVVEGFLSGIHRSPYFGQSVEFIQHREYTPGDEVRHIDWKVWAKQDRYYVKQYEEDTNLRCTMLIDVSESMQYGSSHLTKYEYGCTVATSLAYMLLRQQDAVGCVTFDDAVRMKVPLRSKRNHLQSIIQALSIERPREKTGLYRVLRDVAEDYPQRGMIVLISDLLVERPGLLKGLTLLRQRGHDVMVFHILDRDELKFEFTGPTRFDGLEIPDHLTCNPRALRDGYLEELRKYLDEIRVGCAKANVDYGLISTGQPLDAALAFFLSNRLGMHHKN